MKLHLYIALFLLSFHTQANDQKIHLDAEFEHKTSKRHLSGKTWKGFNSQRHPWPFELLSIGHSMSSYQNYGGRPYFHHGLDIRGDALQEVKASAGGKVVNIENYYPSPLYWEVAILDDDGLLWQYHHIDRESIPEKIWQAFRSKGRIESGEIIGKIVKWPVSTFGEFYHHVHLNVLDGKGNYLNPFEFLERLPDDSKPEIVSIKLLKNGRSQRGTQISGKYQISVEVKDLVLHDKFILPPYRISYSLNGEKEVTFWQFDNLPGGTDKKKYVEDFYVKRETCGNYSCRKHIINLGFMLEDGGMVSRQFPTSRGQHKIEIKVWDYAGNSSSKELVYTVN